MTIDAPTLSATVAVGVGATLLMDLWALFLKLTFGVPLPNYCVVGRWISYIPQGTLMHASIGASAPKRFECAVGWITHYVIGTAYALALVALVSRDWLSRPTLLPALLFGIVSVVIPFFIMQPAFGLGVAASRAPDPTQVRLRSFMAHTVFGLGLYASAVAVSYLSAARA